MNAYRVEVVTEGREVYYVQAASEDDARRQVNEDAPEVTGGSVVSVEQVEA